MRSYQTVNGCVVRIILSVFFYALITTTASANDDVANALKFGMPAAAVSIAYAKGDDEGLRQFAWAFGGSVGATYALKSLVDKERPDGTDNDSFPSGHATSAFASAAFLDRRYGHRYGIPAYALATWVAYSRVDNDHHYLEDVAAGAAIALIANRLLTTKYDHDTMQISMAPNVGGASILWSAPF